MLNKFQSPAPVTSLKEGEGVYRMTQEDVRDAVTIHLEAFTGFFLTFLGPKFLIELYSSILNEFVGDCFCIQI